MFPIQRLRYFVYTVETPGSRKVGTSLCLGKKKKQKENIRIGFGRGSEFLKSYFVSWPRRSSAAPEACCCDISSLKTAS